MYELFLTEEDMDSILWVGHRYGWSYALLGACNSGMNYISECEAWHIKEKIEEDEIFFPCLDPDSQLFKKLIKFYSRII